MGHFSTLGIQQNKQCIFLILLYIEPSHLSDLLVYIETVEYFDASIVCTLLGGGRKEKKKMKVVH